MNTPKSSDEVMRELNDLAKVQSRFLAEDPWSTERSSRSILDVPLTPEAQERIRRLDERLRKIAEKRAEQRDGAASVQELSDGVIQEAHNLVSK